MKRLKVALMHFCFEDYTIELANALAELVDLTLIQPEKVANFCRDSLNNNVKVISFPKPRVRHPGNLWAMSALMKIIQDLQPDVLHVQETNDPWYDLTLLLNKMPPLVTTIHDVFPHPGDQQNIFGANYTKRISFYRSQQIIVHANFLKQILHQQFKLSPERVQVLSHGEFGNLYQRRSTFPDVSPEPYTLLFFGRVWPYKGLQYLLAALPIVAAKFPTVKLVIAGKGENLNHYFSQGYNHNQIEIINDFIPPSQVASIFQRSTIVVLPYIEASQSGVVSLAYGMGKLVVASAVGGLQEVVRSGQDGLLVPPGDVAALAAAIIELFNNQQLQAKLRAGALARCTQDLDWHKVAWQTVNVYRQAIATNHRES
jgi:glycosyltransferase involved in cell wall biosynthesis